MKRSLRWMAAGAPLFVMLAIAISNLHSLSEALRSLALVFLGACVGYGLWDRFWSRQRNEQVEALPDRAVEELARQLRREAVRRSIEEDRRAEAEWNGWKVDVWVDSEWVKGEWIVVGELRGPWLDRPEGRIAELAQLGAAIIGREGLPLQPTISVCWKWSENGVHESPVSEAAKKQTGQGGAA